ncbi:furfural resistance protein [Gammaproteobacteria bacterium]|nr:furfural resistance protein [Gammaproteobacteria bacterium]
MNHNLPNISLEPKRLRDKSAIITGAAQGIGAAIATLFAQHGAKLMLVDLDEVQLSSTANAIFTQTGQKCETYVLDISNKNAVKSMTEASLNAFGQIDILINNAGMNVFNDPLALTDQEWEKCFNVDLNGAWYCAQAILPHMLERKYGNIVNIASVHGHKIIPNSFPYPVAKHGLIGLTKALGIQYAAANIRVNSISPGLILTPNVKKSFGDQQDFDAYQKEIERQIEILPCKRIGEPLEVAYTALFLASDEARFINASDILIDGGRSQLYCDN